MHYKNSVSVPEILNSTTGLAIEPAFSNDGAMKSALQRFAIMGLLMALAATMEFSMGRRLWGIQGQPGLWSGDIWSSHNSQFLADPYTLTHVIHGVVLYGLTSLGKSMTPGARLIAVVGFESGWEVLENSPFVIQRYRKETIGLDYFGDSIANSMFDIVACMCGALLAKRLPKRIIIPAVIAAELLLAIWIRDNLTLNIIMLLTPNAAIRGWQLGK